MPSVATPPLWYIGGSVRSGSTLLAGLVSLATGGFNAGELHLLWRSFVNGRLCTCGVVLRECPVWGPVQDLVLGRTGLTSAAEAARVESGEPSQRATIVRGLSALVPADAVELRRRTEEAITAVSGASALVDSSKVASTVVVADRLPRSLRVLQLVRDPRAVAFSLSRPKPDPSMSGQLMPQHAPARSAVNWLSYNLAFERMARQSPRQAARIRYEDLVADPYASCERLGLKPPPAVEAVSGGHAIAGNPWRFDPSRAIQIDDRWKGQMPARERRLVEAITLPLRARYGY
ncbi:MAG: hypothetical protein ACR2LF_11270 [Jatrophihabitantaceae bacterium]